MRNIQISYDSKLNGFEFALSRSLGVKYIGGVGLPIYCFLFRFNSNTLPNSAPLQTTSLRIKNNTDLHLPRSLNVKCNFGVDFVLVSNTHHMPISHGLAVNFLKL